MKKLFGLLLLLASTLVYPLANDVIFMQRNPGATGVITRIIPWTNYDSVYWYDPATMQPRTLAIGSGLSVSGGTLTATTSGSITPTISLGTVTTGTAAVNLTGTAPNYTLSFVLQPGANGADGAAGAPGATGPAGPTNTLSIGTVGTTTGAPSASITGTAPSQSLNLTYTVPAALSINDTPGRSLVTATNATGFQISSTRNAQVCYEGSFSTTSTIGGPASATVFLETADTNSTTPGDWTTKARQTYSNTITLAVVLNQVQSNNWTMCRIIPAGKYVRIRSGSVTGTASASINTEQQETLL